MRNEERLSFSAFYYLYIYFGKRNGYGQDSNTGSDLNICVSDLETVYFIAVHPPTILTSLREEYHILERKLTFILLKLY